MFRSAALDWKKKGEGVDVTKNKLSRDIPGVRYSGNPGQYP
jgi:hypothetical protein